eukprot:CAMPEP_0183708368 /NCGR_PEP_ID=MMETSP0737-20130205/4711_1 /TAXON_ID=385413 /ORGANISM="Thalassiosira miniscula, Strain CCMP1093" /LENGTH=244 /DNA_ID=CAMNT_0025936235 /DNA_START=242 /DNA_END=981 /DNA_ORIENTATION=-
MENSPLMKSKSWLSSHKGMAPHSNSNNHHIFHHQIPRLRVWDPLQFLFSADCPRVLSFARAGRCAGGGSPPARAARRRSHAGMPSVRRSRAGSMMIVPVVILARQSYLCESKSRMLPTESSSSPPLEFTAVRAGEQAVRGGGAELDDGGSAPPRPRRRDVVTIFAPAALAGAEWIVGRARAQYGYGGIVVWLLSEALTRKIRLLFGEEDAGIEIAEQANTDGSSATIMAVLELGCNSCTYTHCE